eukprot:COSAG05_NODE_31_length_28416_cov_170.150652_20_plen_389_part_00
MVTLGANATSVYVAAAADPHEHGEPLGDYFPFLMCSLVLGTAVKTFFDLLPRGAYQPPYSVVVFALGIATGFINSAWSGHKDEMGALSVSTTAWAEINPHVIMYGLLPPLLFESAFGVDFHVFKKVAGTGVVLAVPGVVFATLLTGSVARLFFFDCCGMRWWTCWLLGSIMSATDPVAVVSVLGTLGAPKHLSHMIEGESLFNDGSAVVVFNIAAAMLTAHPLSIWEMLGRFVRLGIGGAAWGIVAGYIAYVWCRQSRLHSVVDVSILLLCVYGTFYVGENTLGVSGVLGTVFFGILLSRMAPHGKLPGSYDCHSITTLITCVILYSYERGRLARDARRLRAGDLLKNVVVNKYVLPADTSSVVGGPLYRDSQCVPLSPSASCRANWA